MTFRCPECRTRRKDYGLFLKHLQTSGHALCKCGGYHYAHRPGTTYCHRNPAYELNDAIRREAPPEIIEDLRMDLIDKLGKPGDQDPPF